MKEAMFYKPGKETQVQCTLCPHMCRITDGNRGICNVRKNVHGKLYSLVYGKIVSRAIDPIEKKPLYHFMPGTKSYSIAAMGCNFRCQFCQNSEISQAGDIIYGENLTPNQIVNSAKAAKCESISYTYTEPTVFYEFALDTAILSKKEGLKNIFVSNGFTNPGPLKKISPYLDAANIDLKSFDEAFYREVIGGKLKPVLDSIRLYHSLGIHLEITTLIIPNKNDKDGELRQIAEFISSIDNKIPWHVSRFHPDYKMQDLDLTPEHILKKALDIGKKAGLKYIYIGNIPGNDFESTYCEKCNKKIIERNNYNIKNIAFKDGRCIFCGEKINIIN